MSTEAVTHQKMSAPTTSTSSSSANGTASSAAGMEDDASYPECEKRQSHGSGGMYIDGEANEKELAAVLRGAGAPFTQWEELKQNIEALKGAFDDKFRKQVEELHSFNAKSTRVAKLFDACVETEKLGDDDEEKKKASKQLQEQLPVQMSVLFTMLFIEDIRAWYTLQSHRLRARISLKNVDDDLRAAVREVLFAVRVRLRKIEHVVSLASENERMTELGRSFPLLLLDEEGSMDTMWRMFLCWSPPKGDDSLPTLLISSLNTFDTPSRSSFPLAVGTDVVDVSAVDDATFRRLLRQHSWASSYSAHLKSAFTYTQSRQLINLWRVVQKPSAARVRLPAGAKNADASQYFVCDVFTHAIHALDGRTENEGDMPSYPGSARVVDNVVVGSLADDRVAFNEICRNLVQSRMKTLIRAQEDFEEDAAALGLKDDDPFEEHAFQKRNEQSLMELMEPTYDVDDEREKYGETSAPSSSNDDDDDDDAQLSEKRKGKMKMRDNRRDDDDDDDDDELSEVERKQRDTKKELDMLHDMQDKLEDKNMLPKMLHYGNVAPAAISTWVEVNNADMSRAFETVCRMLKHAVDERMDTAKKFRDAMDKATEQMENAQLEDDAVDDADDDLE